MSSNDLSVQGARILPTERPEPVERLQRPDDTKEIGQKLRQIESGKELKEAELRGEPVTISDEQLIRSIERAIKAMQGTSTQLEFSIHNTTKQIMVKVLDKESGKVIREIPPEKTLDFVAKMWEMAGILVDERR